MEKTRILRGPKNVRKKNYLKNDFLIIYKKDGNYLFILVNPYLERFKVVKEIWDNNNKSFKLTIQNTFFFYQNKIIKDLELLIHDQDEEILKKQRVIINKKDISYDKIINGEKFIANKRKRDYTEVQDQKYDQEKKDMTLETKVEENRINISQIIYNHIDKTKLATKIEVDESYNKLSIDKKLLNIEIFKKINPNHNQNNSISLNSNISMQEYVAPPLIRERNIYNNSNNFTNLKMMGMQILIDGLSSIYLKNQNALPHTIDLENEEKIKPENCSGYLLPNEETMQVNISKADDGLRLSYNYKINQGRQSSIQIYEEDYETLNEGAYLNDKIIMFYLKFLQGELTREDLVGKVSIFDSYFYEKLSNNETCEMSSPLINYNSVKKWTKNSPIFKNDFIFVPINQEQHWSLLLICYPGRMENFFKKDIEEDTKMENKFDSYPFIFYLDSFYNDNPRCRMIFTKYLFYEYSTKNNLPHSDSEIMEIVQANWSLIRNYIPVPPKQPNTYDCGIYLLMYAELFLYDPSYLLKSFENEKSYVHCWFSDKFTCNKRKEIQNLINSINGKTDEEISQIVNDYKIQRNILIESGNYDYQITEHPCIPFSESNLTFTNSDKLAESQIS